MPSSNIHLRSHSTPSEQLTRLSEVLQSKRMPTFADRLRQAGESTLLSSKIETLQINLGKMCNQTCKHCHVDAGPTRKEIMSKTTLQACLKAVDRLQIQAVDLTGGAPEMNPHFFWFVEELSRKHIRIIVRCNLTILLANQKYARLPAFYAKHKVEIVASLPHFMARRTDAQRGEGVFEQSIEALRRLQAVGYGIEQTDRILHLVYNPAGAFLPASQQTLEKEFKEQLLRRYNLRFNNLYVITNMPIARFFDYLEDTHKLESYMETLVSNFSATNVPHVMCRTMLSVGWDGKLYDCDFNQMLEIPLQDHIENFDEHTLQERSICVQAHCYGCTAGAGSSCGGRLTSEES